MTPLLKMCCFHYQKISQMPMFLHGIISRNDVLNYEVSVWNQKHLQQRPAIQSR